MPWNIFRKMRTDLISALGFSVVPAGFSWWLLPHLSCFEVNIFSCTHRFTAITRFWVLTGWHFTTALLVSASFYVLYLISTLAAHFARAPHPWFCRVCGTQFLRFVHWHENMARQGFSSWSSVRCAPTSIHINALFGFARYSYARSFFRSQSTTTSFASLKR